MIKIIYTSIMHILMSAFVAVLFFLLTPGVVLCIPEKSSIYMQAAVHALVFALVYHLTHKMVWKYFYGNTHI